MLNQQSLKNTHKRTKTNYYCCNSKFFLGDGKKNKIFFAYS